MNKRHLWFGHDVEILSIVPGVSGGKPVVIIQMRPNPEEQAEKGYDSFLLMFSSEQAVRLRDTLNQLLNKPEFWTHMPIQEQHKLRMRGNLS